MKHAVKVRIYPTNEQKEALSKAFDSARWFWNNSLAETNRLYKETGKGLSQQGMNECENCGTKHDRDVNAAINIRDEGMRILALGTSATANGGKVRPKVGRRKSSVSKALPAEVGSLLHTR